MQKQNAPQAATSQYAKYADQQFAADLHVQPSFYLEPVHAIFTEPHYNSGFIPGLLLQGSASVEGIASENRQQYAFASAYGYY